MSAEVRSDDQLNDAMYRKINPGLVSERIKSLLAKNLATADSRKPPIECGPKNRRLADSTERNKTINVLKSESDDARPEQINVTEC